MKRLLTSLRTSFGSPLARRIALAVFLGLIVAEAVLFVPSAVRQRQELLESYLSRSRGMVEAVLRGLPELETPAVRERVLAALLGEQRHLGVALYDGEGQLVGRKGILVDLPAEIAAPEAERVTRSLAPGSYHLLQPVETPKGRGAVLLYLDYSGAEGGVLQFLGRISLIVLALSLAVAAATALAVGHFAVFGLKRLKMALDAGWDAEAPQILEAPPQNREDEIGDAIRGFNLVFHEISVATEELRRTAQLPEDNPQPVLRIEPSGRVAFANAAARACPELFSTEAGNSVISGLGRIVREALRLERVAQGRVQLEGRNFEVVCRPTEEGLVSAFLRDATEERALFSNLEVSKQLLEDQVAERTASLSFLFALAADALDSDDFQDAAAQVLPRFCDHWSWPLVQLRLYRPPAGLKAVFKWHDEAQATPELLAFEAARWSADPSAAADPARRAAEAGGAVALALAGEALADGGLAAAGAAGLMNAYFLPIRAGGKVLAIAEFYSAGPLPSAEALDSLAVQLARQLARVAERDQSTAELRAARDTAELANRTKTELLSSLAEELHGRLLRMLDASAMLTAAGGATEGPKAAAYIASAMRASLALVEELLDPARPLDERAGPGGEVFSLEALAEGLLAEIAEAAGRKGLSIASRIDPRLPAALRGDPQSLRQALRQLLDNAVEYTKTGNLRLELSYDGSDGEQVGLVAAVADSGPGMTAEQLERLLAPAADDGDPGTRGLARCRRLTEHLGGSLGAESAPGLGARFWIRLALPAAGPSLAKRDELQLAPLAGKSALVIESQAPLRQTLIQLLADAGLSVAGFATASEAVMQSEASAVDFAVFAAGEDLRSLAAGLRSTAWAPEHCILLAPAGHPLEPEAIARYGLDGQVQQPFHRTGILAALAAQLHPGQETATAERLGGDLLLVEDNHIDQLLAKTALLRLGHRVTVVGDGEACLAAIAREHFDLVIMDRRMPKMDGLEATRRIRAAGRSWSRVPIIAMTADDGPEERAKCLAAGMNDFLGKPVDRNELAARVGVWLRQHLRVGDEPSAEVRPEPRPEEEPLLSPEAEDLLKRLAKAAS